MTQAVTQVKDVNWLNLPDGNTDKPVSKPNSFKVSEVAKTPNLKKAKKIGVVGISKAENEQLGLLVRWIALELDWDTIPNEVLVNPEALTKLIGRYQVKS